MYRYFILLCYLAIPFLPTFNASDIVGAHWFYLSVLNSISIVYLVISNQFNFSFDFRSKLLVLYFVFIIFCFFSLFFSEFLNYTIQDLSRIISVFFSFLIISSILRSFDNSFFIIYKIFVFMLLSEIFLTFYPYINYLIENPDLVFFPLPEPEPNAFKGIAANVNISSASILSKLPFLLYGITSSKNLIKALFSIILFLSFIAISILGSRAALISISIILFLFTFYVLVISRSIKFKFVHLFIVFFSCFSAFYIHGKIFFNPPNIVSTISSINISNESSSNRFELWSHAIDYSLSHPLGSGLGIWKIKSAPYWKFQGNDYTIPYHAHNDFLELSTEIGIFGSLAYLSIFILISIYLLKSILVEKNYINIFFLMLLSNYFLDSLLNFPMERYVTQLMFAFLISYTYNLHQETRPA